MADPAAPKSPSWARWVTRAIFACAIVGLVLAVRSLGQGSISHGLVVLGQYLRRIGWWWLAVVPMEMLCTTLDATAMRAFSSPEKDKIPFRHALLAQLSGRAVNAVTPSGNLGEVAKISVLTERVSQSRAVSTILLYNVVSFSVELLTITVAGLLVFVVPLPLSWQLSIFGIGVACALVAVGLYVLVHRGLVTSFARLLVRIIYPRRHQREKATALLARWEPKTCGVDDKMRLVAGASRRDRWIGICAILASRTNSILLSLMILHAVGETLTMSFIAAYLIGSNVIYFAAQLVPMGVGVSESGYWSFYRMLGENPARGVTLVVARRTVTILYATIGLVLMTTNETIKGVKQRHRARGKAAAPVPSASETTPLSTPLTVVRPMPVDKID
jgi:uncharacterized protein (TIRG00374 family)